MTTLVTGATGHIGANLVRALLARGTKVRALVHQTDSGQIPAALAGLSEVELCPGDVRDLDRVKAAMAGVTNVYHLAGRISVFGDPDGSVVGVNVEGTQNVVSAALEASVTRLVHCGSIQSFDFHASRGAVIDESVPLVAWGAKSAAFYDRSKAEGERRVHAAIKAGLDAVIVNPTGVMGPCDFAPSRLGQVFLDLRDRKLPSLTGGAFDWVDVRDVSEGMILAMERGRTGENYLLGHHHASVVELARVAQEVTGAKPPRFACPLWVARASAPFVEIIAKLTGSDPLYTRESLRALAVRVPISHEKAALELGYAPRPFAETIRDIYADFSARGV